MTLSDLHSDEATILRWHADRFAEWAETERNCGNGTLYGHYVATADLLTQMAAAEDQESMRLWFEDELHRMPPEET